MILAKGKLYDSSEQGRILSGMEEEINHTLAEKTLSADTVITAIDALGKKIADGIFDEKIAGLAMDGAERYKSLAAVILSRENIEYKPHMELGEDFFVPFRTKPPHDQKSICVRAMPLGTLLHIAAGNVDGLPAFSLAEGLLTGNINIVKLPQADDGLSLMIITTLIEIEPALSDFIYVFDTPSDDLPAMKRMADMADGIVVWGGDAAVSAVRQFAPAGAKLIEWGHKLGFAYISGYQDKERELKALAEHIASTKQLLCSSCQTIFLDTHSLDELHHFCEDFLPYLETAVSQYPSPSLGGAAEITLLKYTDTLEKILRGTQEADAADFRADGCSLTACRDSELELSYMFGNCYVKRLPKENIISTLRRKKGYLQTAGLICPAGKREELTGLLARAGVVRITGAGNMSEDFCGEAHDGVYPLRRYTRIVNIE